MRWFDRLRRTGEIAHVRKRGRHVALSTLSAYAVGTAAGDSTQVCVSVSKAVGGAVVRNLARRRVRGALEAVAQPGRDVRILFVLKPAAATVPYGRLAADVAVALVRLAGAP